MPETIDDAPAEPAEPTAAGDAEPATAGAGGGTGPVEHRFGLPGRPLRRNSFLMGFTATLGVLLAYSLYLAVRSAASMLVLIFIALFLAIGLHPAVVRLQKWRVPRGLAVAIVALAVVLLLIGGLFALVPPLVGQAADFLKALPGYIEELKRNETLNDLNSRYDIIDRAKSFASSATVSGAVGGVFGGVRLLFGGIFNVLTVLILTIYFMSSFERVKTWGYRLVPASRRQRVQLIGDEILTKVGAYMVGALAIGLLAGASTFVFLMIAGVAYPFALAVVVAVTDLIPQIGATLGAIVVTIAGFATSTQAGVASIVFFLLYQQVENYLIYPQVMKRSVEVSDLAAIVAALLGVALLGVIGALIAIPAVAAIQLIVREVVFPRQDAR
ncbi:AI-2E family transporter [Rhizomonospora bruguierae]|uniref:AI-2E family transporter n=1 Tax=Rhizomonospora bruguierae TaxID=1581705 RepID=UPI001BCE5562|nr:AI-2E family transporter [Micromonospora sp. NBRC 107566]